MKSINQHVVTVNHVYNRDGIPV